MYYFTADEHYGHINILKYCNRSFKDISHMDNEIIKRHNSLVKEKDTVFHLGDFTLKNADIANQYIARLNGKHIFLRGSHDNWDKKLPYILELKDGGIHIVMCHYAMRVWPRSHYGSIQLYGHSHGKLEPIGRQYDVGVDNNDFYPVSLEKILKKILKNN